MSNDAAWRLIFGSKPKYTSSFQPKSIPRRMTDVDLPAEDAVHYSSPYASNANFMRPNNNKKHTVALVQSDRPLTVSEHNKLVNKLKSVTAV